MTPDPARPGRRQECIEAPSYLHKGGVRLVAVDVGHAVVRKVQRPLDSRREISQRLTDFAHGT